MTLTINTDGGSRGNPGPAAWAYVIKNNGKILHQENGYLGVTTNNRAEYMGVVSAMRWVMGNVVSGQRLEASEEGKNQEAGIKNLEREQKEEEARGGKREDKSQITFILDSELVARQLSGVYKIKDEGLRELAIEVKELERKLGVQVRYTSVPRAENKEADRLVNECLDENGGR